MIICTIVISVALLCILHSKYSIFSMPLRPRDVVSIKTDKDNDTAHSQDFVIMAILKKDINGKMTKSYAFDDGSFFPVSKRRHLNIIGVAKKELYCRLYKQWESIIEYQHKQYLNEVNRKAKNTRQTFKVHINKNINRFPKAKAFSSVPKRAKLKVINNEKNNKNTKN